MHLMYFTEQPMNAYPEDEGRRLGYTSLLFPNEFYDAEAASRLYNERLEEYVYAEEMGVDGIMLNEHHNAPFSMSTKANIMGAALAAVTERVKLVMLGNPLPLSDDPVRIAEELAMIDLMSKGRLVSGFVRGGGVENIAANSNPAFNRERFNESHDLIIETWTKPGPFRWERDHFHYRCVNPWAAPLQKPHPRIWVPGISSKETIEWAAGHRYPYIALNLSLDDTLKVWDIYDQAAERAGYRAGPEQRGYLIRCHVADTAEKADRNGREFMWMQGEFTGLVHPIWSAPSGYLGPWARRALAKMRSGAAVRPEADYDAQVDAGLIIAGTPDQVIERLKLLIARARPSILALWGNDGHVSHEDSMTCIRLMGQEVMPALREFGDYLDLRSPFELDTPVSLAATPAEDLRPIPA